MDYSKEDFTFDPEIAYQLVTYSNLQEDYSLQQYIDDLKKAKEDNTPINDNDGVKVLLDTLESKNRLVYLNSTKEPEKIFEEVKKVIPEFEYAVDRIEEEKDDEGVSYRVYCTIMGVGTINVHEHWLVDTINSVIKDKLKKVLVRVDYGLPGTDIDEVPHVVIDSKYTEEVEKNEILRMSVRIDDKPMIEGEEPVYDEELHEEFAHDPMLMDSADFDDVAAMSLFRYCGIADDPYLEEFQSELTKIKDEHSRSANKKEGMKLILDHLEEKKKLVYFDDSKDPNVFFEAIKSVLPEFEYKITSLEEGKSEEYTTYVVRADVLGKENAVANDIMLSKSGSGQYGGIVVGILNPLLSEKLGIVLVGITNYLDFGDTKQPFVVIPKENVNELLENKFWETLWDDSPIGS